MQNALPLYSRYPGTRSFDDTKVEHTLFFGRRNEVHDILHQLLNPDIKILVLYGRSGLGKTSLLRAGLFPNLRHHDLLPLPIRLNDQNRPPLDLFFEAIAEQCRNDNIDYEPGETTGLWEFFKTALFFREHSLLLPVLVLDQFEELFTLQDRARRLEIVDELADITSTGIPNKIRDKRRAGIILPYNDRPPDVKILISLREEDLGALDALTGKLPGILERLYRLKSFDEHRAREALEEPAKVKGEGLFTTYAFSYDEQFIDHIITFLKGQSDIIEPFQLQILCQHIEHKVRQNQEHGLENVRVNEAYFDSVADMELVLKNFYEITVKQVTPPRQYRRARKLCEEGLINHQGRRLSLDQMVIRDTYGVNTATLNTLVDRRLLRRESRLESVYYEMSHDIMAHQVANSRKFRIPKQLIYFGSVVIAVIIIIAAFVLRQQELSHEKELAETLLANSYMTKGIEERDTKHRPLNASHYFIRATNFAPDSKFARKAQFASAALIKGIYLRDIQELKDNNSDLPLIELPVSFADSAGVVASPNQNHVIAWKDDGATLIWNRMTDAIREISPPAPIRGATFSADGQQILSWSIRGTAHLWDAATETAVIPALKHKAAIWGASFSPNGQQILTWSTDKTARLWDAATGDSLTQPIAHQGIVRGAMFSRDGQRILTWSDDATARVWNSQTGKALSKPLKHEKRVWGAVFSPNEKWILTWSEDHTARVWNSRKGRALSAPLAHKASVIGAKFSLDGLRVLTWSEDHSARVWDSETGVALTPPLFHKGPIKGADFSPIGKQIRTWEEDGAVRLWDSVAYPSFLFHLPSANPIHGAAFNMDGNRLLTWRKGKKVSVWDLATGSDPSRPIEFEKPQVPVRGAQFSPQGDQIVIWSTNAVNLWEWNRSTDDEIFSSANKRLSVRGAMFSPNSNQILIWSDKTVWLWDRNSGVHSLPVIHKDRIWGATFNPEGTSIITWSNDGTAHLRSLSPPYVLEAKFTHKMPIRGAVFSHNGQRILTWGLDNKACVWNRMTEEEQCSRALQHHARILGAIFSPDGDYVLSWDERGTVHSWNSLTGDELSTLAPDNDKIRGAQFTPDGLRILTWSKDNIFRIWDNNIWGNKINRWNALTPLLTYQGRVKDAVFSVDGHRILTWDGTGAARLWTLHVDYDTPRKHFDMGLEVQTGTRLNNANELEILSTEEWKEKKEALRSR